MASRKTSSEQKNEGQRNEAKTSADSTSMLSTTSDTVDNGRLTAEQEQEQIQESVDSMLGNDNKDELVEGQTIKVKTLGPYMLQDPTTGHSVTEAGDEVPNSAFIRSALDEGRITKA